MKFIIVGRNVEVTPGLRSAVEDKIGKLAKYFNSDTEVHVTLSIEKDRQKIEVFYGGCGRKNRGGEGKKICA